MHLDKSAGARKRLPIPLDDICKAQYQCRLIDDLRWLMCLISDTGMCLAEGAGLIKTDIILDADIPYVRLKPHHWQTLKTASSQRKIPLLRGSLWAAQKLLETLWHSPIAFPRYNKRSTTNANSASAALNK